jgi:predicted cobalt transporter CbtA
MLAGVMAAMLATLFANLVAEPQIDLAIGVEELHQSHHNPAPAQEELVSRGTQKSFGLLTALALYGAAIGGIFALVFAYGYGRLAQIGPRSFALMLAMLGFLVIVIMPSIKYPQTPPAVGQHETVGLRTAAYFGMIFLSIAAALLAGKVRLNLARSMRGFDANLYAVAVFVSVIVIGQFLLPTIDEVPADFPATLLWSFRIASIGTQLVLWSTLGIAFGLMADRLLQRATP